jgi:hypothetical protein
MPHCRTRIIPALTLAAALTGCAATPQVATAILTSGAALSQGKRTEVHQFNTDDFVIELVSFTWPGTTQDGGFHEVSGQWYRDGTLISQGGPYRRLFASSPWTIRAERAAALLGVGHFKVQLLVDGDVAAESEFDITAK